MKGLYKGKYLIAVYDKDDFLIDVACSPSELTCFNVKDKYDITRHIGRIANGSIVSDRIFLIDVTEKHNDIFAEEDQLFLEFIKETRKTKRQELKEKNISYRTYYRKQALQRMYNSSQYAEIMVK